MDNERYPTIAIVGAAGIFPGACDLAQFWQNIVEGKNAIGPVPPERWPVPPEQIHAAPARPDKARSLNAGLIADFVFRPQGLALAPETLAGLDPVHQLVLEIGRRAWQDCQRDQVDPRRVDTVLAAIALPTDAASRLTRRLFLKAVEDKLFIPRAERRPRRLSAQETLAAGVTSFPAALLGAALNLGGGTLTLDAACASSLFAVKLACDALQAGRADAVLAGGVARPDILYTQIGFTQLQALSLSGRCAPFDRAADGLVVGEGCGIVVLKRLADALRQGDTIHAVIRSIGVSNDMRGNLLAPDSDGQLRAMQSAYAAAGWAPSDVDLIECHGAATPVGDATELRSLRTLWGSDGWQPGQCALGSIKSMIGHLLTAAGAAGLIKVLLGLQHQVLPPSLNFSQAPPDSPLGGSPFRVQTEAEPWRRRSGPTPRRAAVSAFGFGGINAHLLLEEWPPPSAAPPPAVPVAAMPRSTDDLELIAVVGMEAHFGPAGGLAAFQETVFKGTAPFQPAPSGRWKNCRYLLAPYRREGEALHGAFLNEFQIDLSDFRIPPKEIADILPQHLLMLKVALAAMKDAGLPLNRERPRMGCIVGMAFDLDNTNFHLRWDMTRVAEAWAERHGLGLSREQIDAWAAALADACAPPLTHTRTLGALGGLIASRVAREFRFGGPSFTVSDDAASGLNALAIAAGLLRRGEVDAMLVGAVDLPGDLRRVIMSQCLQPYTGGRVPRSLDHEADGTLPGEGAAALVLKRLTDARRDGDRVYALVRGLGAARGGQPYQQDDPGTALTRALAEALAQSAVPPQAVGYLEAHGSGHPTEDGAEYRALQTVFADAAPRMALGALKACLGHAGAAAGLAGLVKTALCLHHQVLPPLPRYRRPPLAAASGPFFHVPRKAVFWPADREDQPRRACLNALTAEGNAMSVVMEEAPPDRRARVEPLRFSPTGTPDCGLFVLQGHEISQLKSGLARLAAHLAQSRASGRSIGAAAREWFRRHREAARFATSMAFNLADYQDFDNVHPKARQALQTGTPLALSGLTGCHFTPRQPGPNQLPTLVYPGSGNHYVGMGRQLSVQWPRIWRDANQATDRFASQCRPARLVPYRSHWSPGWPAETLAAIDGDPLTAIFGQVVFGCLATDLLRSLGVAPSAVIGYSLGETVGYFATGAWPDRGRMLARLEKSDLFRTQLAGPCLAVRRVLPIPADRPVAWRVAVINRPAGQVRERLNDFPALRLLIINTPDECVVGGHGPALEAFVRRMACEAVYLEGVVAVHCEAVQQVAAAYRELHRFPATPPPGITYYSCARAGAIDITSETAADSLLQQASRGFDFPATIEQAYADGQRLFIEVGPRGSCTRMIGRILNDRPHLALSLSSDIENEAAGVSRALAVLAAEGQPVDLARFFPTEAAITLTAENAPPDRPARPVTIPCGGAAIDPPRPAAPVVPAAARPPRIEGPAAAPETNPAPPPPHSPDTAGDGSFFDRTRTLIDEMSANLASTGKAHQSFLALTEDLGRQYARAVDLKARLVHQAHREGLWVDPPPAVADASPLPAEKRPVSLPTRPPALRPPAPVAFDREMCMEFAVGSVARVLGPAFAAVDRYPARVRLPDEPLMLVDRILSVTGEKGVLGPGRLVTEHDVHPGAWYLDGDRAPVCIAVEAGQADLFLSAYLGIDLEVKGRRTYRLLDAAVTFHRGLPRPGEVIRYDIEIEKFIRQGPTWLFFFRFDGTIDGQPLITMRQGCAGFFTEDEVRRSGGIILTEEDRRQQPGIVPDGWQPPVPMAEASYDSNGLEALRRGDLGACFGALFENIRLPEGQRLPGGRMALIHRVLDLAPRGGRYGLGIIRAEADIHPHDWFLTCHFVDDMVMPGTLMYECCAHTLRIFLQRMGWISDRPDVVYEPVIGRQAILKCRGPVTPETRHVVYEVELREIGFNPEPYVTADAHMYADGHRIVLFQDMTMKMTGMDRAALDAFWAARPGNGASRDLNSPPFSRDRLLEFATGLPSRAFGPPYRPFDQERFIARLPGPPYAFIHRVTRVEPPPWILTPGGWVETACDSAPGDWYFRSNGAPFMPICILMEIALQACGFLAAYMGSALQSEKDLHFRNLDGEATLQANARPDDGPLQARARLLKFSAAGDMLIEHYAFEVDQAGRRIYEGRTAFGFFTIEALARQVGLPASDLPAVMPPGPEPSAGPATTLEDTAPLTPDDPRSLPQGVDILPSRALRMIDRIEAFDPQGGATGLGFVRGAKTVDPEEWFFKAHFFQDPVCPGSLGIESLVQLLRFAAGAFWPDQVRTHAMALTTAEPHVWRYRGQILPSHGRVEVEAVITERREQPHPVLKADGYLKCDGLYIYKMQNFGLSLTPRDMP